MYVWKYVCHTSDYRYTYACMYAHMCIVWMNSWVHVLHAWHYVWACIHRCIRRNAFGNATSPGTYVVGDAWAPAFPYNNRSRVGEKIDECKSFHLSRWVYAVHSCQGEAWAQGGKHCRYCPFHQKRSNWSVMHCINFDKVLKHRYFNSMYFVHFGYMKKLIYINIYACECEPERVYMSVYSCSIYSYTQHNKSRMNNTNNLSSWSICYIISSILSENGTKFQRI